MKYFSTFILLFLITTVASAQARFTRVDYQKESRPAIEIEMPFSSKTIDKAVEDFFLKKGYKGAGSKGFEVYKGVRMPEWGADNYDIYFKSERKSRRDRENSDMVMMVSKGFDAFVSEQTDMEVFNNAKQFLDSLIYTITAFDLEEQIAAQEEEVKSAAKKFDNLNEDGRDLEKKKRKLEDQISENNRDRQNQENELEKQKQILQNLIIKRS